jgi:Nitroreductase family
LIKFHALQRPKTSAAPIHETMLNQRNIAMNTSVIEAIERQKTTNLYDASKSIPDDEIRELVRLATFSPTAFHLQNWHFIAVRSPEAKARAAGGCG